MTAQTDKLWVWLPETQKLYIVIWPEAPSPSKGALRTAFPCSIHWSQPPSRPTWTCSQLCSSRLNESVLYLCWLRRSQVGMLLDNGRGNCLHRAADVLDLYVESSQSSGPGRCVEPNELVHLINASNKALFNEHGRGDAFSFGRINAKELGQLLERDIVI
mmetsp:Transcript_10830/g.33358  ORF Transcript_10830/g.33358 Transcript_10830/m.33358 type:complete len:160 (+) Transcript_10830:103-582(+)